MRAPEHLQELQIPEDIINIRDSLRERRLSRYQKLMEQHSAMKREERIRWIRDFLAVLAAILGLIWVIASIVHRHDED